MALGVVVPPSETRAYRIPARLKQIVVWQMTNEHVLLNLPENRRRGGGFVKRGGLMCYNPRTSEWRATLGAGNKGYHV